jgi:virginiamycin A acetyltransferase
MRTLLKHLAFGLATVVVSPALASFAIRSWVLGSDRALEGSTQALSLVPGLAGQYLRRAFLCRVLAECHPTATVEFGTVFSCTGARLEADVYVGPRCHLGLAHVKRGTLLAAAVHVPSGARIHPVDETGTPLRDRPLERRLVTIGEDAWIGTAAIVMADVGDHTIVGAGAVVTAPLPPRVVAAGVPARVVKTRS